MRLLMTESWITAPIALTAIGIAANFMPLVVIASLIFGLSLAARIWTRLSLERVSAARILESTRIFIGESVPIELTVHNNKNLPAPWIEIRETLPSGMVSDKKTSPGGPGKRILRRTTSLSPNEHIRWDVSLTGEERGFFRIGPTVVKSGDLFGFFQRETVLEHVNTNIVVYPAVYEIGQLGLDSSRPFGDLRGGNPIFEDPVLVSGVREYLPSDNLRRIDWQATARAGELKSRIYEPSRSQALIVALNIPTFRQWQGSDRVLLERGVSVAASVAYWASSTKLAVGLIANGAFPEADRTIRIGAGNGPEQISQILEALAAVQNFTTGELATELENPRHPLPIGSTVVVVAAVMPPALSLTLNKLRKKGHLVNVLRTSLPDWDPEGFETLENIPLIEVADRMDILMSGEAEIINQASETDDLNGQTVHASESNEE